MDGTPGETKPHNFNESLAFSHSCDKLPFWEDCYRQAFPTFQTMINHREDGDHQRQGIDRSVILTNAKQLWIDEKARGRNRKTGKVYDDVALEYWSDVERQQPGWVCKPLLCDFIAYAIVPKGICYLLPVQPLQNSWLRNKDFWLSTYGHRNAPNETNGHKWTTKFCPVPPQVLFPAIGQCLRITFEPILDFTE